MKLRFKVLCLAVVLFASALPVSRMQAADSAILFVAPNRVIVPSGENIAVVNVSNRSTEERRYDITVVDQIMNEEGMTRRVDTFDYSAKKMLRFQPKRFTLKPGERQVIRIMAKREEGLKDGDYHSHILFREVPLALQDKKQVELEAGKSQFEIRTLYGIAIPVVVQSGKIETDIELGDVAYVPETEGTPAHIAVDLLRTGNAEASGLLRVSILREGKEPVVLNGDQWIPIYREVDRVTRRVPLDTLPKGVSLKGAKVSVELFRNVSKLEGVAPEELKISVKELTF